MSTNNPKALQFNGSSSRVVIPKSASITPAKNLTIMFNAYIYTNNTALRYIIANVEAGGYDIHQASGVIAFEAYIASAYRKITASLSGYSNGWYNIAATYDGAYLILYIDSKEVARMSYSGTISYNATAPLTFGANPNATGTSFSDYFNGKLDNVSIWSRTLTQSEIEYYMDKKLYGNEEGLSAYWTLDEGTGNKIYDLTQNKNDGTITNCTWIDAEIDFYTQDIYIDELNISKTNIWEKDNIVSLSGIIKHKLNKNVQYKILVNDLEVVPITQLQPTSLEFNKKIGVSNFILGDNKLKIIMIDEDGNIGLFKYIIIKENRDTFIFKRDFNFRNDYIIDDNINIDNGVSIKNIGYGDILLNIPTEGKSKIKNILVRDGSDRSDNFIRINDMIPFEKFEERDVYRLPLIVDVNDIVDLKMILNTEMIKYSRTDKSGPLTFSNNDLTVSASSGGGWTRATEGRDKGKWYWEVRFSSLYDGYIGRTGILSASCSVSSGTGGSYVHIIGDQYNDDRIVINGASSVANSVSAGQTYGFALDLDNQKITIYRNGSVLRNNYDFTFNELVYPATHGYQYARTSSPSTTVTNFGASQFTYSVPRGYLPYDVYNASWFIKCFLKSGDKIYTIINNELTEIDLTKDNYLDYGMSLSKVLSYIEHVNLSMDSEEELDIGRLYRKTIDLSRYKNIKRIEVK